MIIAIDGPAGVGKTSVGSKCAKKLKYVFLSSGVFYRIVTVELLKKIGNRIDETMQNSESLRPLLSRIDIERIYNEFYCVSDNIEKYHTPSISIKTAIMSEHPLVREHVNTALKNYVRRYDNVIIEGRDMTSTVFPDAEVKIYLDANITERAQRRARQAERGSIEDVQKEIGRRDSIDINKQMGALKRSNNVTSINTTSLRLTEVCKKVIECIVYMRNGSDHNR